MKITTLGIAAALALSMAGTAEATVLATAPAASYHPRQQTFYCWILNLDSVPRTVQLDVMGYGGNVLATRTADLQPNATAELGDPTTLAAWCRFTVPGSGRKYRAHATYDYAPVGYTLSIPAS